MSAKPKTLVYADNLASVERKIVDALPSIVDGLISGAKEGDVKAATYLVDRILGRVADSTVSPADDQRIPFTLAEHEEALAEQKRLDDPFGFFRRCGAPNRG